VVYLCSGWTVRILLVLLLSMFEQGGNTVDDHLQPVDHPFSNCKFVIGDFVHCHVLASKQNLCSTPIIRVGI